MVEERRRAAREDAAAAEPAHRSRLRACTPEEEYRAALARIAAGLRPGERLDRSRVDHAIARRLLGRGATQAHVRQVLLASARVAEMGWLEAQAYVDRTTEAAKGALTAQAADHGGGNPGRKGRGLEGQEP